MSSPPQEDFSKLQKLLAMKRHETPPPRFFHDFSESVLQRLHCPEPAAPATWWQRMGLDFDLKPAFVCAWGVAICSSLVIGIISSLHLSTPVTASAAYQSGFSPARLGAPTEPADTQPPVAVAGIADPAQKTSALTPVGQFSFLAHPTSLQFGPGGY